MKKIENRTTEMDKGEGKKHTYADLLALCVNQTPPNGFTVEMMSKRLRVLDATRKAGEAIELEDADAQEAKEAVNAMRWGVLHADIGAFVEAVNKSL